MKQLHALINKSAKFFNNLFGCQAMKDDFRDYDAEKWLALSIQEAINLEFGFIACGKSFNELMKEWMK